MKCIALTLCQTTMLWSIAHPQSTIPTLITILVVMAGVEGNWMIVYKTISKVQQAKHLISNTKKANGSEKKISNGPVRNTGMDTKNPATAQIRVTAESFKNFLILNKHGVCLNINTPFR